MSEAPPRIIETHISLLFCVGDRVYKLRKPVAFGFLDFSDRTAREADCQREVALNRRLAPDVYLGVADIVVDGEPVDHMVVMRRMPEDRRLAFLARRGADLGDWLRQVARALATFHAEAERSAEISAAASPTSLLAAWDANFAETAPFVGSVLDHTDDAEIRTLVRRWIAGRGALLGARVASGKVCDGHGDLQAEDIFCLDDGVRILDCIEFSDLLRYGDVAADVAFLAMDLERLGRSEAGARFVRDYEEFAGEHFPLSLLHHYCASRAYVRSKVTCLRVAQGLDDAGTEARRLHALALSHLRQGRVVLVVVGGLPGSGKSTLAAGLAEARGWGVLRSDEIRLQLDRAADAAMPPYETGRYSPSATALVYRELLARAERLLESGESVILDASWIDAGHRREATRLAWRTSSDLVELRCVADAEEAVARISRRSSDHADISEATPDVRAAMARREDPWDSALVIDTVANTVAAALGRALEALPPVAAPNGPERHGP